MANMRYFAEINGATVQLSSIQHDSSIYSSAKHFTGLTPDGQRVQVSRAIDYARNPSLHRCDDRCQHAIGHKCQCSCGGKNHGRAA